MVPSPFGQFLQDWGPFSLVLTVSLPGILLLKNFPIKVFQTLLEPEVILKTGTLGFDIHTIDETDVLFFPLEAN